MTYWLSFTGSAVCIGAEQTPAQLGISGGDPVNQQGTANQLSVWYKCDSPGGGIQLQLYNSGWSVMTLYFVNTYWQHFTRTISPGEWPLHISLKNGNGTQLVYLGVSVFDGTANDALDPANPDYVPPAPTYCAYGTEVAPTAGTVEVITEALVAAVCALLEAPWLEILFAPAIGYTINSGILCGTGPPPLATITPNSLLGDLQSKITMLEAAAWYLLCQCKAAPAGQPPPVVYVLPVVVIPTGWPPPASYTCSNSDICTTLQLILKRLDELSTSQSISLNQTTNVYPGTAGLRYTPGLVNSGLAGSGTFTIADLVGLRVELTSVPYPHELVGNPPYVWDAGWLSVSDGGAMLQEVRLTRYSFEWFPREMDLATTVGFYLLDGVQARITELVPSSP